MRTSLLISRIWLLFLFSGVHRVAPITFVSLEKLVLHSLVTVDIKTSEGRGKKNIVSLEYYPLETPQSWFLRENRLRNYSPGCHTTHCPDGSTCTGNQ